MAGFVDIVSTATRNLLRNVSNAGVNAKTNNIVMVVWEDACYLEDVVVPGELKPMVCVTVGHLLEATDSYVTVALERFDDGTYRRALCVPRPLIREYKQLEGT